MDVRIAPEAKERSCKPESIPGPAEKTARIQEEETESKEKPVMRKNWETAFLLSLTPGADPKTSRGPHRSL